ncbi:hypothetical protein FHS35_001564 [Streptomyces umbrinus]|nr:hypothetical protein [Streptomyces umbrinus]GHH60380.1 hypothetical protein GCM10018775_73170 [Streptomyces umbrinus]
MRRFRRALTKAVLTTLLVGSTAGWASESSESALSGPLPGTAAWLADDSLGKDPPDPNTATPSEVAVFFADLTDTRQQRLVEDHPTVVGDGITADHVVTDPAGLPTGSADRAARAPGVDAAVSLLDTQVLVPVVSGGERTLQGAATQGISGSGAQLAKVQDLDVRSGSLDRVGAGRIAIDKTLATSAKVKVGDELPLHLPDGTEARPEVVAVYGRGLGLAAVTMDRASLAGHVTSPFDSTLLVRGGDAKPLTALGEVTDASGYAVEQNVDRELGAWANYTMAAVLGGFAVIAAVNTLVMTVLDRRRELATLRLVGSTRRQVLHMLHWESLLVSVAGVALGTTIAMITLTPMMRGLTGESPHIPPLLYATFAATAVSLGLLAVTLPARAALRDRQA